MNENKVNTQATKIAEPTHMGRIFREYLFEKRILVNTKPRDIKPEAEEALAAVIALGQKCGIQITEGAEWASALMVQDASEFLGLYIPEPFYRGFPDSVRELTQDQILLDKVWHYVATYGLGLWDGDIAKHSVLERDIQRLAFNESFTPKTFKCVSGEEGRRILLEYMRELVSGSRPMSENQMKVYQEALRLYNPKAMIPDHIPCKQTAVQLYVDTGIGAFTKDLQLSDAIKLLDYIQWRKYNSENLKKLNLRNKDRKLIEKFIDRFFVNNEVPIWRDCFEKRQIWKGLLHHIHYKPKTDSAKIFLMSICGDMYSVSVYSRFERELKNGYPSMAANTLLVEKGMSDVIRHLDYILSSCRSMEQVWNVLGVLRKETDHKVNPAVILQYLMRCGKTKIDGVPRTFNFTKHNKMRVHKETEQEMMCRTPRLNGFYPDVLDREILVLRELLANTLNGRLGKVWIDPNMKNIAIPLDVSTGAGGFGVLPTGSVVDIPKGKKIRAFTYWEKVNDIDLSCFAYSDDGKKLIEFSWRTFGQYVNGRWPDGIVFSGDETKGFNGGSEYFDIDLDEFQEVMPTASWLIFCDNVYSDATFDQIVCQAGFMMRDEQGSGQIFEPKTVSSSFRITAQSTQGCLFAIDLYNRKMIWLNLALNGRNHVAGTSDLSWLNRYLQMTAKYNMYDLYTDAATEVVKHPSLADVIVTDIEMPLTENMKSAEFVHSWDIEKMRLLLNA